jgi:hypothetical protein
MEKETTEIASVFTVTNFRTGEQVEEVIEGYGQDAIKWLRNEYPRHTKFVLDGFEFDGTFVPLYIKNRHHD